MDGAGGASLMGSMSGAGGNWTTYAKGGESVVDGGSVAGGEDATDGESAEDGESAVDGDSSLDGESAAGW